MDIIADGLTKVRNAIMARHTRVVIRHSKMMEQIADIMQREGYLRRYQVDVDGAKKSIRLYLRTHPKHGYAIRECHRVSRSSQRIYQRARDLKDVKRGLGTCIVSTSKGVMTVPEAREANVGGEIICTIF